MTKWHDEKGSETLTGIGQEERRAWETECGVDVDYGGF